MYDIFLSKIQLFLFYAVLQNTHILLTYNKLGTLASYIPIL